MVIHIISGIRVWTAQLIASYPVTSPISNIPQSKQLVAD